MEIILIFNWILKKQKEIQKIVNSKKDFRINWLFYIIELVTQGTINIMGDLSSDIANVKFILEKTEEFS